MMIGNTHDETRSLIGRGDPAIFNLSWEDLPARLKPRCAWISPARWSSAEYRRLYPRLFAATCSSPPPPPGAPGARPSSKPNCARRRAHRPSSTSSTGARPRRAASGAPATRSTSRWCSERRRRRAHSRAIAQDAQRVSATMSRPSSPSPAAAIPTTRASPRWEPYTLPRRADHGVRRRIAPGGRSARRRAPPVRQGALHPAGKLAHSRRRAYFAVMLSEVPLRGVESLAGRRFLRIAAPFRLAVDDVAAALDGVGDDARSRS